MSIKTLALSSGVALIAATALAVGALALPAATFAANVVTVTSSNSNGWSEVSSSGAAARIVSDSSHTGNGALELTTTSDVNSVTHYELAQNFALSDLQQVSYDTKQLSAADATNGNATLRISIDTDGDGVADDQLMYEPYYNGFSGSTGWNTWTITQASGKFWSNNNLSYNSLGGVSAGSYDSNFTLADVLSDFPGAKVVGVMVSMGTYNVSQQVLVDDVNVTTSSDTTTYDFELPPPLAIVYVDGANGNDTTGDGTSANPYQTVTKGVSEVATGGTVNVAAGTYNEDVTISAPVTLKGAGEDTTTVEGLKTGSNPSTITVGASNVTISDLTVTRDGDNTTDWGSNTNTGGVHIQSVTGTTVQNVKVTGNRNGVYINNAQGTTLTNDVITNNWTGIQFANNVSGTTITGSQITDNFTMGILFNFDTGNPTSAVAINHNTISGNWYGDVESRYTDSTGPLDITDNYFGTANIATSSANSTEPSYGPTQVPTQFGGTATAPTSGVSNIEGVSSSILKYSPWLCSAGGTETTDGTCAAPGGGGGGGGSISPVTPTTPTTPAAPTTPTEPTTPTTPTASSTPTGNGGQVLGASTYNFTQDLWYHMKNVDDTAALQSFLVTEGYSIPDAVTRFFGPETLAAVKSFQKANGVPTTGYVGPLTRAVLNRGVIPTTPEVQ